jgi:PAS domain S-box-containing protein
VSAQSVAAALVQAVTPGSGIGLAVHDEDLRMLLISPSLAELSGTPAEAQLGVRLTEALPGAVGEVAEASLRTVAETGEPLLGIEPAIEKGRERGWLISVFPLDHAGRALIAVVALDVTQSREAHERLEHSRRLLADAQRMAGVGSWSWDVDADSWTWSDELYRIAGLQADLAPPDLRGLLASIPPESRDAVRDAASKALRDGEPFEVKFAIERPGGDRRIIRCRGVPARGPAGRVVRVDGFAQDITELAHAEEQQTTAAVLGRLALSGMPTDALERHAADALAGEESEAFRATVATILASARERMRAEEEVAAQSEARGRLVAQALDAEDRERRTISEALHDGPLQDLLALGHDVSRLQPAADGDEHHLERVRDGIAHAVQQIREVMLDLHPVLLQVGGLDSALNAVCAQHARLAGFECDVEIADGAAGQRDELVLALVRELLRNASKHAGAGRVTVRISRAGRDLVLDVTDDGAGIPAGRLREALGQGHIGVASSMERVEAIGGRLRVGARSGGLGGTQATATLPLHRPSSSSG